MPWATVATGACVMAGTAVGVGVGGAHVSPVAHAPLPMPLTEDWAGGALVIGLAAWGAKAEMPGGDGGRTTRAMAATTAMSARLMTALTLKTVRPDRDDGMAQLCGAGSHAA